jgi:signal transduction histidine kinase
MPQKSMDEITSVLLFTTCFTLTAAVLLLLSFNINHKRKILHRQQLLEKEYKTREQTIRQISRDLHDEIGSSLSGINLFAQMAEQQLQNNQFKTAEDFLQKIKKYSETVIEKTGDMVWMLQPENDTQEKILQRLLIFADSVTRAKRIELNYEISAGFLLPTNELLYRKNIYLICKEAINNSIKYSGCSMLTFLCKEKTITIADNGGGFDLPNVSTGHGLQNMQQRAIEAGVRLVIDAGLNKGTSVLVLL